MSAGQTIITSSGAAGIKSGGYADICEECCECASCNGVQPATITVEFAGITLRPVCSQCPDIAAYIGWHSPPTINFTETVAFPTPGVAGSGVPSSLIRRCTAGERQRSTGHVYRLFDTPAQCAAWDGSGGTSFDLAWVIHHQSPTAWSIRLGFARYDQLVADGVMFHADVVTSPGDCVTPFVASNTAFPGLGCYFGPVLATGGTATVTFGF